MRCSVWFLWLNSYRSSTVSDVQLELLQSISHQIFSWRAKNCVRENKKDFSFCWPWDSQTRSKPLKVINNTIGINGACKHGKYERICLKSLCGISIIKSFCHTRRPDGQIAWCVDKQDSSCISICNNYVSKIITTILCFSLIDMVAYPTFPSPLYQNSHTHIMTRNKQSLF